MNKVHIYVAPTETTSPKFGRAFLQGCPLDAEINKDDVARDGIWAGFGSPQNWQSLTAAIKSGRDWYYGDHAYFGRRKFYRITKNAFQHDGRTGRPDFRKIRIFHEEAKPFKKDGRYILVCLHTDNFHARMGSPNPHYVENLIHRIKLYSDREIIVRSKQDQIAFDDHLREAWAVVTHSSACALHALLAGVPAFTTADSCVSHLTMRDPINIERPYYPSTLEVFETAAILAANQWTLGEIAGGEAWRKLNTEEAPI